MANILSFDKQIQCIAALTEGVSIRATERLTGVHRDTIMRLGVRIGEGCGFLHDRLMRDLQPASIELDEIWAFVGKKQKLAGGAPDIGDQYTFIGMDTTSKTIISHLTGKRNYLTTMAFVADLEKRVLNRPRINTDGFEPYVECIQTAFGYGVTHGQVIKSYSAVRGNEAAIRYSPGSIINVSRRVVVGEMHKPSTSYVERQNLTLRMSQRRFSRLTNGFSKKLENHRAAVSLYVAHYNLCRIHEAHRITPAMALGVSDHIWEIGELVGAATDLHPVAPGDPRGRRFQVIDGGLS